MVSFCRFHVFYFCNIAVLLLLLTFVWFEPNLSFTVIFENVSTACELIRKLTSAAIFFPFKSASISFVYVHVVGASVSQSIQSAV